MITEDSCRQSKTTKVSKWLLLQHIGQIEILDKREEFLLAREVQEEPNTILFVDQTLCKNLF